jgi:hypothetical protein
MVNLSDNFNIRYNGKKIQNEKIIECYYDIENFPELDPTITVHILFVDDDGALKVIEDFASNFKLTLKKKATKKDLT